MSCSAPHPQPRCGCGTGLAGLCSPQCRKGSVLRVGEAGGGAPLKAVPCFYHHGWFLAAETRVCTSTDPDFQPLGPG